MMLSLALFSTDGRNTLLPPEMACLVAPHVENVLVLQVLLVSIAVSFLVQARLPFPYRSLGRSAGHIPRYYAIEIAGRLSSVVLSGAILGMDLVSTQPRRDCQNATTIYGIGVFEIVAMIMDIDAIVVGVIMLIPFLAVCIVAVLLCSVPVAIQIALRRPLTAQLETLIYGRSNETLDLPPDCAICLQAFEGGELCQQLPCNSRHFFHIDCAKEWVDRFYTCPICRADIRQTLKAAKASPGARTPLVQTQMSNLHLDC